MLDAICVVDAEGRFVFVSAAAERIFGYTPDEMIGKAMIEMVVPEDRARTLAAASEIMSGHQQFNFENRYLRKDGQVVHVMWSARWSEKDQVRIAVAHDITQRKQVEYALRNSAESLKQAQRIAHLGNWHLDLTTNEVAWSQELYRMYGFDPRIPPPPYTEHKKLFTPESWERLSAALLDTRETGRSYELELETVRKDGSSGWMWVRGERVDDEKGVAIALQGVAQDITERKLAEQRMRQFEAAIDTTHEGFCITDEQGILLEVNHAYAGMVGYSVDELRGMHVSQVEAVNPSREQIEARIATVMSRGWDVFETRHRRKDGSEIALEVSVSYTPSPKRFLAFLRDISQHKKDRKQIRMLTRLYSALSQTNHALIECKNEAELFEQVCRISVDLGGMKMAWIGKVDQADDLVRPVASYGEGTAYLDELAVSVRADGLHGSGPTAVAFREGRAIIAQDFVSNPLTAQFRERAEPYGWGASATFPIFRGGKVYASIALYHAEKYPFTGEMIGLMSEMMVNIGHGLERFELEAEKQKAEEAMRLAAAIYESTGEAVMVTDEKNLIVDVNPAFTEITGYMLEEVRGRNPRIFKSGKHDRAFYRQMWQSIEEEGHWQGEIWDRRKSGELYAKWLNISVIRHADGSVYRHVAEFSDITEKKHKDELIWTQANYDALTNLPNRRLLADRIQQAMASGARSGRYGALIALDLDHFKQLNDTLGHSVGDELLCQVARRLQACVREEDTVARMGGDEFVVVLNELSVSPNEAAAQAEQIAEKISGLLSSFYQLGEVEYHITPSIGIMLFQGHSDTQENLLAHVDTAMYQAKARGRNTICFFDASMQQELERRTQLEHALRVALPRRELLLHYQLQKDNHGRTLGAEALLRWEHPELGMISPAQFIPLAEESGLILQIGHWVLETACTQLARWQVEPRLRHLSIAINVSARQFRESTFVSQIRNAVETSGIRPEVLKLELTESLVLEDIEDTVRKMQELKVLGIKFSMDDFGTGYSSLAYLSRLPFDQLKIDQSFMRNVTVDQHNAAIVQTIISMAQGLGMEVIAEGVETKEQREFLELRGCVAYQGYLFGRPLPIEELEPILKA